MEKNSTEVAGLKDDLESAKTELQNKKLELCQLRAASSDHQHLQQQLDKCQDDKNREVGCYYEAPTRSTTIVV